MPRPLRTVTPDQLHHVQLCVDRLKEVRDTLREGGAKRAASYVSRALKSVEGAARHAERAMQDHRARACLHGKPGERVYAHAQWHEIAERLPNGVLLVRTFEKIERVPGLHDGTESRPRDTLSAIDRSVSRGYITHWPSNRTSEERWLMAAWSRDFSQEPRSAKYKTLKEAEAALRAFLIKCPE